MSGLLGQASAPSPPEGERKIDRVTVNGVQLAYSVFGRGPVDLLFVHGYGGRATSGYSQLSERLAPHFRVWALDLRGHGGSAHVTDEMTFEQMTSDIIAAVDELRLVKPVYVGHSLGGLLGLSAELGRPGIFSAAILLNAATARGAKGSIPEMLRRGLQLHRDQGGMTETFRSMFVRELPEQDVAGIVETVCLMDPAANERWSTEVWPSVDISGRLAEIKVSTLFINGARDNVVSVEEQHRMAMALPCCKEVTFTDEGHMLPLEAPERAAREIVQYCQGELERSSA